MKELFEEALYEAVFEFAHESGTWKDINSALIAWFSWILNLKT